MFFHYPVLPPRNRFVDEFLNHISLYALYFAFSVLRKTIEHTVLRTSNFLLSMKTIEYTVLHTSNFLWEIMPCILLYIFSLFKFSLGFLQKIFLYICSVDLCIFVWLLFVHFCNYSLYFNMSGFLIHFLNLFCDCFLWAFHMILKLAISMYYFIFIFKLTKNNSNSWLFILILLIWCVHKLEFP